MCRSRAICRRRNSTSWRCSLARLVSSTLHRGRSSVPVIMPTRWFMRSPIIVPDLGQAMLILSVWYVKPGEAVYAGDRVVELLLGSATFDIAAPCTGTLSEQAARPDDPVTAGQVVGYVE